MRKVNVRSVGRLLSEIFKKRDSIPRDSIPWGLFHKFIDLPSAIAGAVIMGTIVGVINRKFGFLPATTAALKQAAYTFLLGGMLIRLLYYIVKTIPGTALSVIVSVIVVSVITTLLVYGVHRMKGTPLPFHSTLPTIILAPPGFLALAIRKKKKLRASHKSKS